ncbi:MAG: GerMN domain-containing protein [Desertimonas sp.]
MTPRRRGAWAGLIALVAGCGYDTSGVRHLSPDELFGLDQTTTTTPTTTSTPTTGMVPPDDSADTTILAPTTSTIAVATQSVQLFFLDGDLVTSVTQNLSSPVRLRRVLEALENGPVTGEATVGLSSAVPAGLINTAFRRGGVAEVDLVGDAYDTIPADQQLPAIAQIVLTLTEQPGVGQVSFTLDGEPLRVRLGNGQTTVVAGQAVSADDYLMLLSDRAIDDGAPSAGGIAPVELDGTAPATGTTDG